MPSDLIMPHRKVSSDFISFALFWFTLVMKLRNFEFESQWNTLIFFYKKRYCFDLMMSYGKMSDFISFPLLVFTLVIKLRNFDSKSHWNTLIVFDKKWHCVRFGYAQWKNVWFLVIYIVCVHFSGKTQKFGFWK